MIAWVCVFGLALAAQAPPPRAAELESEAMQAEGRAIRKHETEELMALAARLGVAGRSAEAEAGRASEPPPPARGGPIPRVPAAARGGPKAAATITAGAAGPGERPPRRIG